MESEFRARRGIHEYKARVVAGGFTQIEGIGHDETFVLIAKSASLCMIIVLAAEHDLKVPYMDVSQPISTESWRKYT